MAPPSHLTAEQTPIWFPSCLQEFEINAGGEVKYTFHALCILYSPIFYESNKNGLDVVSTNELSSFALEMFREMS